MSINNRTTSTTNSLESVDSYDLIRASTLVELSNYIALHYNNLSNLNKLQLYSYNILNIELLLSSNNINRAKDLLYDLLINDYSNGDAIGHISFIILGIVYNNSSINNNNIPIDEKKLADIFLEPFPSYMYLYNISYNIRYNSLTYLNRLTFKYDSNLLIQTPFKWTLLLRSYILQGHLYYVANEYENSLNSYNNAIQLLGKWDIEVPKYSLYLVDILLSSYERVLLVQNQVETCVEFYRNLLIIKDNIKIGLTLKLILFRHLAHILTHSCGPNMSLLENINSQDGYNPSNIFEESVLLLLLYLHSSSDKNTDDNKDLSKNKVLIRNDLTVTLYRAERPDLVAQLYRDAVSINMQDQNLWYKLALALTSARQYTEAFNAISQSLSAFVSIPTFPTQTSAERNAANSFLNSRRPSASSNDRDIFESKLLLKRFTTVPCELLPLTAPYIGFDPENFDDDYKELPKEQILPYDVLRKIERTALASKLCLNYLHKTRTAVDFARHSVQLCLSISTFLTSEVDSKSSVKDLHTSALSPAAMPFISADRPFSPETVLDYSQITPEIPTFNNSNASSMKHMRSLSFIIGPSPSINEVQFSPVLIDENKNEEYVLFSQQLRVLTILSYHLFGLACSKFSYEVMYYSHCVQLQASSLDALERAAHLSPRSVSVILHLACVYADMRKISTAIKLVNCVLSVDSGYVDAWHLMALLFSSGRQYVEAIEACNTGLVENPYHFGLLLTKAKLFCALNKYSETFTTYMKLVQNNFDESQFSALLYESNEPISNTVSALRPSFFPSENFQNIKSDITSAHEKMLDPNANKIIILLNLADSYLSTEDHDLFQECLNCLKCARLLISNNSPWLADIHSALAYVAVKSNNLKSANTHYQTALAVDSSHLESVIRMGTLESESGNYVLAHGLLTSALRQDSSSHEAWFQLGIVLRNQNKDEEASEAFLTSLELERTSPIRSFSTVTRQIS